jgi:pyruvate-formate lyase-activating enzyme
MLLKIMRHGGDRASVPNLVWRDGSRVRINKVDYIDLDAFSSPTFPGSFQIAPYESMRGCPFDCKFCSFPAASPKWRYKSAEKIRDDWERYRKVNGATTIEAMDSTFTVPPTRLRRLMELLPRSDIPEWLCYSRANVIKTPEFVDRLLESYCIHLLIGFESMNEQTLRRMSKRVTAAQNRNAFNLLKGGGIGYTSCFIVGYPGESPEQFEDTRRFLFDDYEGHFTLNLFTATDETMPLWEDREELQIEVDDPYDPASPWSHIGMDSEEATRLQTDTLDRVRMSNDTAVPFMWQRPYQLPLVPTLSMAENLSVEKAVERLVMAPRDFNDVDEGAAQIIRQVELLRGLGVQMLGAD